MSTKVSKKKKKSFYSILKVVCQGFTILYSLWFTLKLKLYGAKVEWGVIFKRPITLYNPQVLDIGKGTIIHEYVALKSPGYGRIHIGRNCKINRFNQVEGEDVHIGNNVVFGPAVHVVGADHNFKKGKLIRSQGGTPAPIRIEDDVWLASKVIVLKGVKIGRGSVVGASAVVTKDIPPYSIAIGIPAKVIKKRM